MKKIYKLFINENIKTWKKFSTQLGIILILLSLIGVLALAKLMMYMSEQNSIDFEENNNWQMIATEGIEAAKEELTKDNLDDQTKQILKNRIRIYELNLKYNIPVSAVEWKGKILLGLSNSYEIDEELIKFIENNDYLGYIQYQKSEKKEQLDKKEITQNEYNDEMVILNLYEKYGISKEMKSEYSYEWRELLISDIRIWQGAIRRGIDHQTNKILTPEKKQEYENKIKIAIYKIENNIQFSEYEQNHRIMFETLAPNFVTSVIAILAIIIAGGAIATEISTGTIKFWALTPNKRWKILTAKILSLSLYIAVITLVMALLTISFANIFFETSGNEYLYVKDGNVKVIGNVQFMIFYYFAKIIPVVVFSIFALMLSVVTRNSSVALSLSIATYMGNGIVMGVLNSYIKKEWVRFIPFNNLNIAEKIFTNFSGLDIAGTIKSFATSTSFGFSFAVLGVCVILMLVTAYDSFNNRDII